MALDYVKSLRDMEGGGQQEALQPRVKVTPEQATAQEANARAIDAENGRYGRFRDQQGKWATAWQAPGRSTPIVPPRFIAPATLKRNSTRELVLQPPEGDALLVSAQQWVVVYDGDGEAIVADDDDFRRVMTPEAKIHLEPEEAEADAAPDYPPVNTASTGGESRTTSSNASIPPTSNSTSLSVDGFVAQVLSDNQRLRIELEQARRWASDSRHDLDTATEKSLAWQREHERLAGRMHWLWHHVTKAMGYEPASGRGPLDRDVEAFLADAGRARAQEEAANERGNGQDPTPTEHPVADAAAEPQDPSPEATKAPPSLHSTNGKPRRTPLKAGE